MRNEEVNYHLRSESQNSKVKTCIMNKYPIMKRGSVPCGRAMGNNEFNWHGLTVGVTADSVVTPTVIVVIVTVIVVAVVLL